MSKPKRKVIRWIQSEICHFANEVQEAEATLSEFQEALKTYKSKGKFETGLVKDCYQEEFE